MDEIAYALYRVSTTKQVDKVKDDIPMQKEACRDFAKRMGWTIGKEFLEKGVSGFKVSATDMDAIQELKAAALRNEFQILLVFMFDRIGRIDDETPFVVEWFVKHGIRVWSVQEGEQRFESHVDKLMNYIRFWQASGESEKTSMRIKTRMQQLTAEGSYTGGGVPFGYQLEKRGRLNKRGKEIYDLTVNPVEAEWVVEIFEKNVRDGYGSHRLATYLNNKGVRTHSGAKFQCNTIIRILRNKLTCGYMVSGETVSPHMKELQIVDERLFERAQFILDQRAKKNDDERQIAMSTKSKAMLSGIMFCAHCGGRLTSSMHTEKYTVKSTGEEKTKHYLRYMPLLIGLYFLIIAVFIFTPVYLVSSSKGDVYRFIGKRKNVLPVFFLVSAVLIFLFSMLFEFLYEIEKSETVVPSSYILALDISGSMDSTDKERKVPKAVSKIVSQMEDGFPFAVYYFNHNTENISPMHNKTLADESEDWNSEYDGGTAISGTLEKILNDYESQIKAGTWLGGTSPKVLLMTDGYSGDDGIFNSRINSLIKQYRKQGIQVSTVGTSQSNEMLMKKIADSTGGVFISVNDVDNIYDIMTSAINGTASRNLISYRYKASGLLSFFRILFLTVILGLFSIIFYAADAVHDDIGIILFCKIVTAVLAAILTELLFQVFNFPELFVHTCVAVLTTLAILRTFVKNTKRREKSYNDDYGDSWNDDSLAGYTLGSETEEPLQGKTIGR